VTHHAPCELSEVGLVCALGTGPEEIWPRLIAGDTTRFTQRDDLVPGRSRRYGAVQDALPEIPASLERFACRNNQLALAALDAIGPGVDDALARYGAHRIGVVMGSSTAGLADAESAYRERQQTGALPDRFELIQLEFGGLSEFVAAAIGATGPCYTLSTACSAAAKTLVSARSLLELGVCDTVIAGGVDTLCRLTAGGFSGLQAIAAGHTNPMSVHRDGLLLGEGAAVFLLTRDEGGIQLLGTGESSDAYHMSAPEPGGRGAEESMRSALEDAGLAPGDIAYLNLHGTGTPHNDSMESAAVHRVLGDAAPCSSTKPLTGHALGASGGIELGFCWMMLAQREAGRMRLPPHRWDGERDPALPLLSLVGDGVQVDAGAPAALMSNSFGFGGSNCSLVIGDPR
jgi:3-oxoacyl-[acyl-carrier-protein] synthase-1